MLPGGRLELGETTENTIIREMSEELQIDVICGKLLWINESFFTHEEKRYHEIGYYYKIECMDKEFYVLGDEFTNIQDGKQFIFRWVKLVELQNYEFYPQTIKKQITELPEHTEKIIEIDNIEVD